MAETRAAPAERRAGVPDPAAFAAFGAEYLEGVRRMHSEYANFVVRRLQDDRETLQALAECRQVSDMLDVQRRWAERWGEAYMREAPKLAAMALENFTPPSSRA